MPLDRYQLLSQHGAGKDGVSYQARDQDGSSLVEVRVLCAARDAGDRWPMLAQRLKLAALLNHPAAVGVRELGLEHDPPYLVVEWVEGPSLADHLQGQLPLPAAEAVALARDLAAALVAAHRLGLVHGRLRPGAIRHATPRALKVDFTGTETSTSVVASSSECDVLFQAPEPAGEGFLASPADVYSLGALLTWLLTSQPPPGLAGSSFAPTAPGIAFVVPPPLAPLLNRLLAADPAARPSATEAEAALAILLKQQSSAQTLEPVVAVAVVEEAISSETLCAPPVLEVGLGRAQRVRLQQKRAEPEDEAAAAEPELPEQLGRYRLRNKLGEGGMGLVYRGEDLATGKVVAIKVLQPAWARRPQALKRFHKEARLLAEVNNPYVTNLLEINEDNGIHYLVLEFVAGEDLSQVMARRGPLDEPTALAILADVARALVEAHDRGIVHRDIKPENILLTRIEDRGSRIEKEQPLERSSILDPRSSPQVKLSDFGLARHIFESESLNLTQPGALLGTPAYMAPEQCSGATVDARSDVYALGATLFHLLTGRPPFIAANPLSLLGMHCNEPPPALQKINAAISDGTCRLVEKMLAKLPEARPANARALLLELERLLRGEPADIAAHPCLPKADPAKVLRYQWTWELQSAPHELWPHVSNTERFNRAVGLPAIEFTTRVEPDLGVQRFGRVSKFGLTIAYHENPFEWVEGRRLGVLREFLMGPFKWLVSITELAPRPGGGTILTHQIQLQPHGLLGRTIAAVEVGIKGRRGADRVYRRIDAALTGQLGRRDLVDPFEEPARLSGARHRRLEELLERLGRLADPDAVERLGTFLAQAPAHEVARIRPLALARRLSVDPDRLVAACLHGAREGLLVLLWDILCPVCRIPAEVKDTLQALRDHGHCEACLLDFDLDFANSVEMIFRAHPEIRDTELGTYCIGGPGHSPHVAAQVRLAAREHMELELALGEGPYRLRGPQLPYVLDFQVRATGGTGRWDLRLPGPVSLDGPRVLKSGGQVLGLTNDHDRELVVRIERVAPRADALTAARAATLALFRELFPAEVLSPGQLASVSQVTLLAADLDQPGNLYEELGDARAFGLVHEYFRLVRERIHREGGALVKTVGEGLLAAFTDVLAAVRVGLELQPLLAGTEATRGLRLRVAVHRGAAVAATVNDHLDYFGLTVTQLPLLLQAARGGEAVLTQAVAADPAVDAWLRAHHAQGQLLTLDLPGQPACPVHLVRPGVTAR